jgi:hypothetical protein
MTLRSGIGPLSSRRQRSAIHTICGSSIVSSLLQPVSALDELYESFHEPRRRSAIDNIVVKGHRQIEHVPRFDSPSMTAGLRLIPPTIKRTDCPAGARSQPPPRPAMPSAVTPTVPAAVPAEAASAPSPDPGDADHVGVPAQIDAS